MINYRIDNRFHIIGAGVQSYGGMWPSTASNWWEAGGATGAVAVYQPKGAGSLAASYTDMSGSGNTAIAVIEPPWDSANGWKGNGNAYLSTALVPSGDWSLVIRFSNTGLDNAYICGQNTTGKFFSMGANRGGNRIYGLGNAISITPGVSSGVMAISATDGYLDGVDDTPTSAEGFTGAANYPIYLLALNNGGSVALKSLGYIQAVAIYNTTLTAPKIAAVSAAMALL
jgi:hypothetical protein